MIYNEAGAAVFAAMAPLGAVGFILTLVAVRRVKAQPQRAGSGG
jgi:PPP family 3-phenylpropionic acid transporter